MELKSINLRVYEKLKYRVTVLRDVAHSQHLIVGIVKTIFEGFKLDILAMLKKLLYILYDYNNLYIIMMAQLQVLLKCQWCVFVQWHYRHVRRCSVLEKTARNIAKSVQCNGQQSIISTTIYYQLTYHVPTLYVNTYLTTTKPWGVINKQPITEALLTINRTKPTIFQPYLHPVKLISLCRYDLTVGDIR